jgi:hypothetical protein
MRTLALIKQVHRSLTRMDEMIRRIRRGSGSTVTSTFRGTYASRSIVLSWHCNLIPGFLENGEHSNRKIAIPPRLPVGCRWGEAVLVAASG